MVLALLLALAGPAAIAANAQTPNGTTAVRKPAASVRPATALRATATPRKRLTRAPAARAAAATRPGRQPTAGTVSRSATAAKASARRHATRTSSQRPVVAARRPGAAALPVLEARTPFGLDDLRADLGSLAGTSIRSGSWGMMVVSLSHGDTLFSVNPDVGHVPASTQKLLTSVLALDALGPQFRFHTDVLRSGQLIDGKLDGDLILRGDGDPTLSMRFMGRRPDAAMDSLAARVVAAGVREVTGRVIGDASAFESRSIPEGWHPRILQDAYAARVSALSLNENLLWVTIRPTSRGSAAQVVLEPASAAIPLSASVRTVGGSGAPLRISRNSGTGRITVTGSIGVSAGPRSFSYVVEDPASFTTGAFLSALQRHGVKVGQGMALARTPAGAEPVASWTSLPLDAMLTVMNRESVNVIAEHLFRAASRGSGRQLTGSAFAGDSSLRHLLQRTAAMPRDGIRALDGSGLSQLDRVTPRTMVQLLGWADRASWGPLFHSSLPLAGESGTLRRRMFATTAQTNLHAKTGTTNDVIALAGYVTARNGELLAFSMTYNGADRWRAREAIDAIGVTLANWAR